MTKKNKKYSVLQFARLLTQIVFFIFLPSLYISAFAGFKQIYLAIINQGFNSDLLPQLIEIISILPVTIILGRYFCGWMCAFGSYGDFIYRISHKVFKIKRKMNEQTDAWMKYIKYGVLISLIAVVWSFNLTVFNSASPWNVFGMIATVGHSPDFSIAITSLTIGFVIFVGITVASFFVERFFCRYLCPLGAIFAITSKLRISKIKKPSSHCGSCRICTNSCAMGIPLYKTDIVKSVECINCMKCINACPRSNTTLTISKNDVRPLIAGVATVSVMTGMYYTNVFSLCSSVNSTATVGQTINESSVSNDTTSDSDSAQTASTVKANSKYIDGTYQGSGNGFRGTTTVSVAISNDKITSITVDSYRDDNEFFNRACSTVTNEIISNQSSDVDAVSGATYSSDGIMTAVSEALSKALR